jgi:hypothetical protein
MSSPLAKRPIDSPPRIQPDPIEDLVAESDQLAEGVADGLAFHGLLNSPEAAIADSLNAVRLALLAVVAALVRLDERRP